ncbi:MAG: hypothetical protein U0529_12555 [Thermoanaerobaculia bacterium]
MRRPDRGRSAALLAVAGTLALAAAAGAARAEELPLADGSVVPAHAAIGGGLSDREAARRRAELLRSPFMQVAERRSVLGGEAVAGFESAVPPEVRDAAVRALERTVREVLDRDGWPRPFSAASPLTLLLVHPRPDVPVLVAWDGREKGRLARPVVAIGTSGRSVEAVAFDVARSVALLAVRQAGPDEAGWAVEGLAEFLAEEALGRTAPPKPGASPFLAARGSLASPDAAALFLREAARLAPGGREGLRAGWEEAGSLRGDDADTFFRAAARGAGDDGATGLLASLVAGAVADASASAEAASGKPLVPGEAALASPAPLGWSRVTFDRLEERGGLEVLVPEACAARGGRAVLVYRPFSGEPDAIPLVPGASRVLPLAGAGSLSIVLVDGSEAEDLAVRLRRVPGYPAVVASSSAEWSEGAVNVGWRTSSHQDLLAWVVSRFREDEDGGLVLEGREIVPTTDASDAGSGFLLVDREARPGTRYRYRVAALTRAGFLSEAFETAVETE